MNSKIDELSINSIRFLGMDQINNAKSGHPGIVLGAAPIIHTLFTRALTIDPNDERWFNRDRFILSAGHGSAMLYATLHLAGFKISIDDLKGFRQYKSLTPGHPEVFHTSGVEASTGPLGQGIATGVGMAIAERFLEGKFNKRDNKIINNYTYVLCGDGCLQEGIAQEAMSLAGTLKLNKFIILYDSNDIQLDGEVKACNTENVQKKVEAMGFSYFKVEDGNEVEDIANAIEEAKRSDTPSLIEIKTQIGYGSPLAGDCAVHGAPLGPDNTAELKNSLGWKYGEFEVPDEVYQYYNRKVCENGDSKNTKWNKLLSDYEDEYPDEFIELEKFINNDFDFSLDALPKYEVGFEESTRKISAYCTAIISSLVPNYMGGCADVAKSTLVRGANGNFDIENPSGRNILFGIREHAMGAIVNGLVLSGMRAFCGCFLAFSDYMKDTIRMAALMKIPSLFVYSHDSIAVGEDGPTHEPIEQLVMLRSIPNTFVFRPCDPNEMAYAYKISYDIKDAPSVIISTRQKVRTLASTSYEGAKRGGYIVRKEQGDLDGIIIASGSEVSLACDVADALAKEGKEIRVVSMPCTHLFDLQDEKYKESIIPTGVKSMALEMASPMSWYRYTKNVYGIETFGLSAPAKVVQKHFGFTVENLVKYYKSIK